MWQHRCWLWQAWNNVQRRGPLQWQRERGVTRPRQGTQGDGCLLMWRHALWNASKPSRPRPRRKWQGARVRAQRHLLRLTLSGTRRCLGILIRRRRRSLGVTRHAAGQGEHRTRRTVERGASGGRNGAVGRRDGAAARGRAQGCEDQASHHGSDGPLQAGVTM